MMQSLSHPNAAALRRALARHAVWFCAQHAQEKLANANLEPNLLSRLVWHGHEDAAALTVDGLRRTDLSALRCLSAAAFVAQPMADDGMALGGDMATALHRARFKPFLAETARPARALPCWSSIGALEFLLSGAERLAQFPVLGGAPALGESAAPRWRQRWGQRRIVFVLDLVQDFEILRPFLLRAAAPNSPLQPCVAITERVLDSHLAPDLTSFLQQLGLPWFKPLAACDVAAALVGERPVLVTASESSAPGHAFGHSCCRIAPAGTLRITFQHGYECVGLRHHRAHDLQFPQGIRFASDLIFTWRMPEALGDLQASELRRALPVGVTKASAERAATLLQHAWSGGAMAAQESPALVSAQALIIAENLHSIRFASPLRYRRFVRFVQDVAQRTDLRSVIRSHPGKRTLEKARHDKPYTFIEGVLTADHFSASLGLVSPPSTILLDAAMCARPTAVWSDAALLGDVQNYKGLPVVTDAGDVDAALLDPAAANGMRALKWAVDNTAALNGVPAAWHSLCTLTA